MFSAEDYINDLKKPTPSMYKLDKISASYTSGRPSVIFDGESVDTVKKYPYISSYTPVADDRVLLLKVSGSYVIIGNIV